MAGEIQRILDLPVRLYESTGRFSRQLRLHPDAPPLLEAQEAFLEACVEASEIWFGNRQGGPGVVGLMSCGSGKTLALQLAPTIFGAENPLLITEANLLPQLTRDVAEWSEHYPLAAPATLSYGKLSHHKYRNALEDLQPDLILIDEAHRVGAKGTARYKRLYRYLDLHRECRLIAVTGTLWKKSVHDMHAIMSLVLRDWSPLPYNGIIEQWASVLDVGGEPSKMDMSAVRPLIRWAPRAKPRSGTKSRARQALRYRLQTCPGVVVTSGPLEVDVSLSLRLAPPKHTKDLGRLEDLWELPDGTELVDSLEVARHRGTLRLGFFYRWNPETLDPVYVETRRVWGGVVRAHVQYAGFDSPYFVEQAAKLGTLRADAQATWKHWASVRETSSPPETEAVWTEGAQGRLVRRIEKWAASKPATRHIVWYRSEAVSDVLEAAGWTVHRAGGPEPSGARKTAAKLCFGTGWNGHEYRDALVLQPPRGADAMEQLLARHHRKHQTGDVTFTLAFTEADRAVMKLVAEAALDVSGTPQRFLLADWLE